MSVEVLTNNEVISCLYNKNATEKCKVGLADALLFENGRASRWYVTGKSGEIIRKRGNNLTEVSARWMKIHSQSDAPVVAIIKQDGELLKFLSVEAWANFVADDTADPSIQSMHCFINGENHNVYRNKFQLLDKFGRFTSSTHAFAFQHLDKSNLATVTTMRCDSLSLVESKAAQINNIMDLATNTVVRYMELMLKIKIVHINLDYVIDKKSQVWLMWASDTKFVRQANLASFTGVPATVVEDKVGRMSWAGPKYREGTRELQGSPSPPRGQSPERTDSYTLSNTRPSFTGDNDSVRTSLATAEKKQVVDALAAQINTAASVKAVKGQKTENLYTVSLSSSTATENSSSPTNYPHALKCKGDYCKFDIHTASSMALNKLFTESELRQLSKDKRFQQMTTFGKKDVAETNSMTMKSIILAQQEKRGLSAAEGQPWNNYPASPRGRINFDGQQAALQAETHDAALKKQQMTEDILSHDKEQREAFTKGMIGYYEPIHVCSTCCNIYSVLDWARDCLGRGDAYGAGLTGGGAVNHRQSTSSKREKRDKSHLLSTFSSASELQSVEVDGSNSDVPLSHTQPLSATQQGGDKQQGKVMSTSKSAASLSKKAVTPSKRDRTSSDKNTKRNWKQHATELDDKAAQQGASFVQLDDYLRSGAAAVTERKHREHSRSLAAMSTDDFESSLHQSTTSVPQNCYFGNVLLACADPATTERISLILEEAYFRVHIAVDGRKALNDFILEKDGFDCVLIEKGLPLSDAFRVTEGIREYEKILRKKAAAYAASQGKGIQPFTRRHPVICVTADTAPEDLKSYISADMDGCVSLPINKMSLLSTMRSSIPQHLAALTSTEVEIDNTLASKSQHVYKLGNLGELEGSQDSSTMASKTLPISTAVEDDCAFNGIVQIDADTRVPFTVMDAGRTAKVVTHKTFFNLVVCHDLFDTCEKMKIFLRPMVQRYLGMQVLLWNYPGQAFTEWREEQLLNNEYLATCLNEVLGQVGEKGTRDFDTSKPFYLLGYGNGVSIASFYASHYRVNNMRGLLNVNGWSFLDSYLAGVMHDCINIFQCSPPTRPDLPVYFFSRFLFSKDYLAKVSVPLALNIYTAVHNSISVKGRIKLCKGVLQSVDVRPLLKEIEVPVIVIQSTQDAFVRPMHTEPFITYRGGEVHSIHKALKNPYKTCVIWSKGGHEVFQENKKQTQLIIEQILTGFHETHDMSFPTAAQIDPASTAQGKLVSNLPWENEDEKNKTKTVEDKFIDNIMSSVKREIKSNPLTGSPQKTATNTRFADQSQEFLGNTAGKSQEDIRATTPLRTQSRGGGGKATLNESSVDSWQSYSESVAKAAVLSKPTDSKRRSHNDSDHEFVQVIDPNSSHFERANNSVYGKNSQAAILSSKQNVHEYPEVKEFMSWRLKRNRKRLQRLQQAARQIQGAFRSYVARKFVQGIRRYKSALFIQRVFRGWRGRYAFQRRAKRIWAVQVIQRSWRGYLGRKWYFFVRLRIAAAANVQRMVRGMLGRIRVNKIKRKRFLAASLIQAMGRRYIARRDAWRRRQYRNCSTTIQRVFRGFLGRKRAIAERNKYIFSRSQSQGIEFGRQMLLEHKLHATRLQSDVTLLTQDKVASEEKIEALLEEISSFEEGVRTLEQEMHQLSKVESEAAAFMDEDSRFELREQKIKLDREFGEMLQKIVNRKDMLNDLERKLSTIDKSRQSKEEELRTLERKLVVLLEEQQNELSAIKRKQDVRGAMLAASHDVLMKVTSEGGSDSNALVPHRGGGGDNRGGGGGSGPSLQEKKQAAQLMQSTETLMKFGFMSMSMTYFSSLNMIKALRTVSAQDTVMAALSDVHAQRAMQGGGGGGDSHMTKAAFLPDLKPGQQSGQQALSVSAWSVEDVAKWLQTLALQQYSEAFIDSAVDGEFLYDLNDDDLKNTLGIEHRLHRKKILNCVHRLKLAEAQSDNRLNNLLRDGGGLEPPVIAPDADQSSTFANPFAGDQGEEGDRAHLDGPKIPLPELFSYVRHSKFSLLKDAIDYLPNKTYDKSLTQVGYVADHGTVYLAGYERLPFHVNKVDEFGNTMLSLACQNGNAKICKYLLAKGANLNHQNKQGQTPAHFAIAYKFFDLSNWLFENGASDLIENKFGLSPYDGLSAEGGDEVVALEC